MPAFNIGKTAIGTDCPIFIVAEVGINHNGDLQIAKQLIDAAVDAGCDAVKFQKRSPEICVPPKQKSITRDTPWGPMSYIDYRHRVEFNTTQYREIDRHCKRSGIAWFASCWDLESVDFMDAFDPPCHKVASACLTDDALLIHLRRKKKPVILSTGMSTMEEIKRAVSLLDRDRLLVVHTTSNYIGAPEELNLRMIETLKRAFGHTVGYSGHEAGIAPTVAAVTLGACYVERHITLDRCMWGSDHRISLEPHELTRMVSDIRLVEKALGDGIKRVYESERGLLAKLRNC